ncbi:hypothetical protein XFF6992_240148 [Xanthomonas citri pv. fuscans]|nr:hypothetical protein XFF6992_240148 [Xanthomonas citri pv. fuscans]SOO34329.1 hypothetical protein XFF6994_3920009 [Xanthomonas citri pv. fuscans]
MRPVPSVFLLPPERQMRVRCRVVLKRGLCLRVFGDSNLKQSFHALRARFTFFACAEKVTKESTPRPRALRAFGATGAQVRQKFL